MSTPPEDPRVRPPRQNRKEKTIVRIGYPGESKEASHAASQQDTRFTPTLSVRQHFAIQKPPLQKKVKQDGEAALMPSQEEYVPVIDTASLTQIACEAMQAIQAASGLPGEGSVAQGNLVVPRRFDGVQAVNPPSGIPCGAFSYQAQSSLNSGWLVPIDTPFLQQDKLQQASFSNLTTLFQKEQQPHKGQEQEYGMGIPRNLGSFSKRNQILPQNSSTTPRLSQQSQGLQHQTKHNQPLFGNSQNDQSSHPQSLTQKPSPAQINGAAQNVLMQFVRNQASIPSLAPNGKSFHLNQSTPSGSRSSPIASSCFRFMDKIRVTMDPLDTSADKPSRGATQANPASSYFLVLHYLISQQASRNKTTNIHLILDRLQASLREWALPVGSLHGGYYMSLQTKVKYMKEFFPYIASIRQWHQNMRNNIQQYQNVITTFRKCTTQVADSKLLLLKSCGAKARQALNLMKQSISTYSLVSEQAKRTAEMLMANCSNNRGFTFLHPNEDYLLICQSINKDYQSVQRTVQRISCLYPSPSLVQANEEVLDMGEIIQGLAEKLALESGNLCELKERLVRLKARYGDRPREDKKRHQWKLLDLLSEIHTLLKRRTARRNDL